MISAVSAVAFFHRSLSDSFFAIVAFSSLLSLLPLRVRWTSGVPQIKTLAAYLPVWRTQTKWAFLGVIVTELTSNAHVYAVVAIVGTTKFAPIAFAALLWRPVTVCVSALTPSERAEMAKEIAHGGGRFPKRSFGAFIFVLIATWLASALGIGAAIYFAPNLISKFDFRSIMMAILASSVLMLCRSIREPLGVASQAYGLYQKLTHSISIACVISIALVIFLVYFFTPESTILGVAASEAFLSILLIKAISSAREKPNE